MNAQLSNLLVIAGMLGVFWFLVIRPQQERAKQQREMVAALALGDEIVTYAGFYGTVVAVGERVVVRLSGGAELELAPAAISRVVTPADGAGDDGSEALNEGSEQV